MNTLNAQEIRTALEHSRQGDGEQMRLESRGQGPQAMEVGTNWVDLELAEVRAARAAMRDNVRDRAKSAIIAEPVAARERRALEPLDVPRPDPADANGEQS
jgi:hypothetical protein